VSIAAWRVRRIALVALAAIGASAASPADSPLARDIEAVVHEYVGVALDSNLALQTQQLEVQRAAAALRAARARFLPEVALQARYTRADGGRSFDVPIGSLLNPAYQTLNELLVAQGQPPRFASVPDTSVLFQREREQDSRITLRQPLYQPAIAAGAEAQRELLRSAGAARDTLRSELRRDVTVAYLGWLKALRARSVLEATREVLDENLRVNESLLRNGRITEDQVLRARTEQLALQQQLREAASHVDQARNYVNFLLNRALETPLEDARLPVLNLPNTGSEPTTQQMLRGAQNRPELAQAAAQTAAAHAAQRATQAALRPSLALGIDAGTQGETWQFGRGYNFAAASLVLSWKLFDGGANRADAARAKLTAKQAALQQDLVAQRVSLEVHQAIDRLAESTESLSTAEARALAARSALRIAQRKRDAGSISQVEFLDVRNAQTTAELALNVTRFDLLQRRAELDFATGGLTDDTP
jgi:outer membrane protein TolC